MKIAICDDNEVFAQELKSKVQQFLLRENTEISISVFTQPKEFLNSKLEDYDIVFLDVLMGEVNGMDVANAFRKHNKKAFIVFISEFIEYAPRGYEVKAFRYLLKSTLNLNIFDCMQDIIDQYESSLLKLPVKSMESAVTSVAYSRILYFESISHTLIVHLFDNAIKIQDSLLNIEKILPAKEFIRIQRSYIVNMRNVVNMNYCTLTLSNGDSLICSRQKREVALQRFIEIQGEC